MRYLTALPVYNEARHIPTVLDEVKKYAQDILVVDDGSKDETPNLLAETDGIMFLRHARNRGYGGALVSAFDFAIAEGYDAVVTIDCDGQHQPKLIPELVAALDGPNGEKYDIVSGSRYLADSLKNSIPPEDRRRINYEITADLNAEFGLNLTDSFCGFKSYRTSALEKLKITEFGYAMPLQLWIQAVAHDFKMIEYPVPLIYLEEKRSFGGSLDQSDIRRAHYKEVIAAEVARNKLQLKTANLKSTTNCCSSNQS
jgi:glycosyltransferase involved in cell wall biosynthesis